MKNRDLFELLAERPIVHPTTIEGVTWRGRRLVIAVRGWRWWESTEADRQIEGAMSLIFDDLGGGRLLTDEFDPEDDEALEHFEVTPASEVPWAQPREWSIFCSGPIDRPMALYAKVHDYLSASDAFLTPEDFFNQAHDLSRFAAMTRSNGFMIARAPTCIRDLVCEELVRQSVPHNVVGTAAAARPGFLVRLGNSAFLCGRALAELPD